MLFGRRLLPAILLSLIVAAPCDAQATLEGVTVHLTKVRGSVYAAQNRNGFGGGNVTASIGSDGILLVDDMYEAMVPKLRRALADVSDQPIRIVINSHFHRDHIEGNGALGGTATIVGHENVLRRVSQGPSAGRYPMLTFTDSLRIRFNGETIRILHLPNAHTDGDAIVYFEGSKVLHMGDTFFVGMFPAVYREGGGDVMRLIASLRSVIAAFPADAQVVPGHGAVSTMSDLWAYVTMLEETVAAVQDGIRRKDTPATVQRDPRVVKYAALGAGGGQTSEKYVEMLWKLLQ